MFLFWDLKPSRLSSIMTPRTAPMQKRLNGHWSKKGQTEEIEWALKHEEEHDFDLPMLSNADGKLKCELELDVHLRTQQTHKSNKEQPMVVSLGSAPKQWRTNWKQGRVGPLLRTTPSKHSRQLEKFHTTVNQLSVMSERCPSQSNFFCCQAKRSGATSGVCKKTQS